jgi:hypothetical protein
MHTERLPDVLLALWCGTNIYGHMLQIFNAAQQHVITTYLDAEQTAAAATGQFLQKPTH